MSLDYFEKFDLLQDHEIIQLKLCFVPITSNSRKLIKLLGGLDAKQIAKEVNLDDFYHSYMQIRLQRHHEVYDIVYEKNEFPAIRQLDPKDVPQCRDIALQSNQFTFGTFVDKTFDYMGIESFFSYSVLSNNCQIFILDHLEANNLGTKADYDFIKQDVSSLFHKYPHLAGQSEKWAKRAIGWDKFKHGSPTAKGQNNELTTGQKIGIGATIALGVPLAVSTVHNIYHRNSA